MSKNITRSKSVMSRFRGRDATASSASLHVTDDAQARDIGNNTFQKFDLGREDRLKLPQRPSTSGGTKKSSGNLPKRAHTVKRETRDDLFFNPLTAHGIDGPTFYNFPLPSTRPPPSPVVPAVPQMLAPSPRPYSPDSIKTSRTVQPNVSELEIGMALGSPSHPPENWQQGQHSLGMEPVRTLDPMDDMSHYADSIVAPKQKKGRKWFGLFGSKREKTPASFYQLKPESQQEIPTSDPSSPETKRTGRSRGRSTSSKTGKKPDMKRSQTAPTTPGLQPLFQPSTSTSIRAGTPDIRVQGPIGVEVLRSYPKVSPEGPKLDLALPSVQMERYSVMFGDILQKPSTTTSSLLQRRQATLDRLKSVEEALANKEAELEARTRALTKCRATSPQPNHNSPSFSLFPSTPSRQGNRESSPTREKSLLNRSNTSPAALSPSRPSFAPGLDNDLHANLVIDDETSTNRRGHEHNDSSSSTSTQKPRKQSTRSSSSSPRSRPQLQSARTWSPDESQLLSPSSAEESEADARSMNGQEREDLYTTSQLTATKSRFEEREPTWQMINSKKQNHGAPSSVSGSTTSEASTISSSHSASSFSSVPGSFNTNTIPIMLEQEKVRERGSRKASPTHIQSSQKDKETKISVKSTPGPRPIISAFNTTTRSSENAPRPILKSPISENQGLRPRPRPSIQQSSSSASLISPRPSLQKSPMSSSTSTSISSPRKIPLPASPHPPRTISSISPLPEPPTHQKQESTSSITPSLLSLQFDDDPESLSVPTSRTQDPEQKRLESAAGVSIARQISVSRQQRQLLIPIKTSGTISKRNREKSPAPGSGIRSPVSGSAKKVITGEDVNAKTGSPLESVTELSFRGGVLSPSSSSSSSKGQSGTSGNSSGSGNRIENGIPSDIKVKQTSKPSTPTLVVVPGVEEQWGAGIASSGGLMSSKERVEAMMKGSRGSPLLGQGQGQGQGQQGWEEQGGKMLSVAPRTEMGTGHQHRRSERAVVLEA
ncbi:uncharacterized protein EAE98_009673 [Botrytis deweyae]|uniref:Uncharacterized protein n=1 Tax=Botrytis deweyae TaxID=2478750 RepID=A0ABQ7IAI7_9HELO|nr:uncharacterized protein EAE98_009673 [Botrytis deweyae]KAF7918430.1 hypothetical protein EAE98_009673 [Botrytis deweyae]